MQEAPRSIHETVSEAPPVMLTAAGNLSPQLSPPTAAATVPPAGLSLRILSAATALVAFVIILMCAPAYSAAASSACNKFASTQGSDSNPGTAAAPFATAKHLLEKLSAGETGCLASGQTFAGFTLYSGNTHGAEGAPVTLTSTNPEIPAIIDSRITTEKGANWLTFTHLTLEADVANDTEEPSPTVGSAHTSWTFDDISGGDTDICVTTNPVGDSYGTGEYTLLENDRVHDCGHPLTLNELLCQSESKAPVCSVENVDLYEDRLNGWHAHGLYNMGQFTTVRNSYFYDNSGLGILLRAGAGAVIEHNVIDGNGRGVEFGNEGASDSTVAWNLITNTTSPCANEAPTGYRCDSFGISSSGAYPTEVGAGNVAKDNDVNGSAGPNIAPSGDISPDVGLEHNVEVAPLYVNAAAHEYTLQASSPVLGYGPDTAQPGSTPPPTVETPKSTPPTEAPKSTPPPVEAPKSPPPVVETTKSTPPVVETPTLTPPTLETPTVTPPTLETPAPTTPPKGKAPSAPKRDRSHDVTKKARAAAVRAQARKNAKAKTAARRARLASRTHS